MQLIIGPLAKRLRLEQGLKQGVVAKEIGTSSGNLCRFEQGQQGLSLSLLSKLTAILGTTPDELLNLNSSPSEIKEIAVMLSSLDTKQLAGVKGFIAALNLDNNSKDT